jgi:hypothetical protein
VCGFSDRAFAATPRSVTTACGFADGEIFVGQDDGRHAADLVGHDRAASIQ